MAYITQSDNQSLGHLGGLFWDGSQWGPIESAQEFTSEEDAAEEIDRLIGIGVLSDNEAAIANY